MDIGQEDVTNRANDAHIILHMQADLLKIIMPASASYAIVGQDGVIKKDFQPLKILSDSIEYDDVGSDYQKVSGKP